APTNRCGAARQRPAALLAELVAGRIDGAAGRAGGVDATPARAAELRSCCILVVTPRAPHIWSILQRDSAARPRVPQDRVFRGRGSREPGGLRWLRALGPGDSVTGTSRRVCMAAALTSKRLSVRDETDAMEMAYDK